MTGTPSRTTTAYGGGTKRHSVSVGAFLHEPTEMPRGYVGRKLQAKLRSEGHKAHMRRSYGGRGRVGVQSPKVIQTSGCKCVGCMERKSHALPRESCLSVRKPEAKRGYGLAVKEIQAGRGACPRQRSEIARDAESGERTREAERLTKGRQKSADSGSCQRTAT
jgi:hypothetical protein